MVSLKVNNDEIWDSYVKTGKVKGFSIEAMMADKMERPKDKSIKDELSAQKLIDTIKKIFDEEKK